MVFDIFKEFFRSFFRFKVWAYSIIGLLVFSCGHNYNKVPTDIHEEFVPYVEEFEELSNIHVKNIIIRFDKAYFEDKMLYVGVCRLRHQYRDILIKEEAWERYNYYQRKMLIFHELGHCILFRDHSDDYLEFGRPKSLMNHMLFSWKTYEDNEEYYNQELINNR